MQTTQTANMRRAAKDHGNHPGTGIVHLVSSFAKTPTIKFQSGKLYLLLCN